MLLVKNRKALFDNELLEKYIAGIVLHGYEVKAIREGNASFEGSYITLTDGNAYVVNMMIGKYSKQSQKFDDQEARGKRQLLLNKIELHKLSRDLAEKGKTAVPLALVANHGRIKLEFAVVKGRKKYEKKSLLKKKQVEMDLQKENKRGGFLA